MLPLISLSLSLTHTHTHTYIYTLLFSCSVMSDSVTSWTVAHQAPLFLGFSRQEYWVSCHFLLQGIFLTRNWTCVSCTVSQILYLWATREAHIYTCVLSHQSCQSCPTLCNSSVHGILQARILEWIAILLSKESSWPKGSNLGPLCCRLILHCLSHQGKPSLKLQMAINSTLSVRRAN